MLLLCGFVLSGGSLGGARGLGALGLQEPPLRREDHRGASAALRPGEAQEPPRGAARVGSLRVRTVGVSEPAAEAEGEKFVSLYVPFRAVRVVVVADELLRWGLGALYSSADYRMTEELPRAVCGAAVRSVPLPWKETPPAPVF